MNGVVHVLDPATALPHDQAFYDQEAANETRGLLTDSDHATSSDMAGMGSAQAHGMDSITVRALAATQRLSEGRRKSSASSGHAGSPVAHVTAGVGEIT